ncbi:LAMI_0D10528g1_1 [Lachancea mirantina]|uniref:Pre-mRNA-splicing factor n=1 Tax=Lachancea mirantina TaxID=1230905 RepID=A0A1G4JEB9_9SACH|nr:LAMI_0D10528g1_1 [Lachancea mirantina]
MVGFSLSLRPKEKQSSTSSAAQKRRRVNPFQESDTPSRKLTHIKLTHVDETNENENQDKPLVIEPQIPNASSIIHKRGEVSTQVSAGSTSSSTSGTNSMPKSDDGQLQTAKLRKRVLPDSPPETTQEEYEEVPIEEFGLALLRGMGWSGEGVTSGHHKKRNKAVLPHQQARPEFSGLGSQVKFGGNQLVEKGETFMPVRKVAKEPRR